MNTNGICCLKSQLIDIDRIFFLLLGTYHTQNGLHTSPLILRHLSHQSGTLDVGIVCDTTSRSNQVAQALVFLFKREVAFEIHLAFNHHTTGGMEARTATHMHHIVRL